MEVNELKSFLKALPRLGDKNSSERIARAKSDFAYFVRTYLGHHIGGEEGVILTKHHEKSVFRRWVYEKLPALIKAQNKLCIKAYRGAAKTTLISRLFVLWLILRGDKRYAILISSTLDLAKEGIDLLKTELEDNANLVLDFDIKPGSVWTSEEIIFSTRRTLCKIKSFGSGKKIRGTNFLSMRPDLIVCDDIENDENIESKTQREKLYSWFNKAILKLPSRLNPHYNILVVGTTLHYDSLLQRLSARDDFQSVNFPLVLQFPNNLDAILADFKANGVNMKSDLGNLFIDDNNIDKIDVISDLAQDRASFFSEFQNLPLDKENAPLAHYTTFEELPRSVDAIFIGIDPSLGKKKGDYFALSQLFYSKAQKKLFWTAQGYKIAPDKMLDKVVGLYVKMARICQTITIACEEVAFQEFFKMQLKARFANMGLFVPIIGIKNTTNKEVRLDALAPLLKDESLVVDENAALLREELDSYPKSSHDDLMDSGEIALRAFNASNMTDYRGIHAGQKEFKMAFAAAKNRL